MNNPFTRLLLALLIVLIGTSSAAQRVGLVLSGGGASGLAHIGVIKALEEDSIPIDYITGTSMGALIGGIYAAGYSVDDLVSFANSPTFLKAIEGELPSDDVYYFTKDLEDAVIIKLRFNFANFIQNTLPANVVDPNLMEFILMDVLSPASAAAEYDFDKLMIPFRCVAADIVKKEQLIFSEGSLPVALRASATYPFYYRPLVVNGTMLFDGGMYNNFPADVMYDVFLPDVILGSNVASDMDPPDEDDLLSQVRSMIMAQSNFTIKCDNGLIIEPESNIGVFDFSNVNAEIEKGYFATKIRIAEIKNMIQRRVTPDEVKAKQVEFQSLFPDKEIGKVTVSGSLSKSQKSYILSMMGPSVRDSLFGFKDFRGQFLRLAQEDKIRYVHPVAMFDPLENSFGINMYVRRERNLTALFGGNFSSRPINMGYVGLKYNLWGRSSTSIMANSYFGRFYGSAMLRAKIDFGGKKRYSLEPHGALNRWDFFRNFSTFFEQSRPSFIVKNEAYAGVAGIASFGNNAILMADVKYGETVDRYYQTENFTVEDTADVTRFKQGSFAAGFDRNTLNRKLYANAGTRLKFSLRGIYGTELTDYGTTRPSIDSVITVNHSWFDARIHYENYFLKKGFFTMGVDVQAVYANKPFFANYTASIISAPAYTPIPESHTFFLNDFRAHEFVGIGIRSVFEIKKNLEFRIEGYGFQPGRAILRTEDNLAEFGTFAIEPRFIGASALVFHSPLGPISLNLNYYSSKIDEPWSFLFNFGYMLFNKSIYEL